MQPKISSGWKGLLTISSMPADNNSLRCSLNTDAVTATILTDCPPSMARMRRVASMPSITGMRRSIQMKWGLKFWNSSIPATPFSAIRTSKPTFSIRVCNSKAFSLWSSTMRTRYASRPGSSPMTSPTSSSSWGRVISSANSIGSSTLNTEPLPTMLWTLRMPPISLTNWLLMAKPKPVPGSIAFPPTWKNASKIWDWSDGLMPMPVSSTSISNLSVSTSGKLSNLRVMQPCGVNLTALLNRFIRIWRSLASSARMWRGNP